MLGFGKNKELQSKLDEYYETAFRTLKIFREAIEYVLENGIDEHFKLLSQKTHECESNADDIRRSIELEMYKKSLLPESRGDLLGILEALDKIPNRAERVLYMMITQNTPLYVNLKEEIKELVELSVESFETTIEAVKDVLNHRVEKLNEKNRIVDSNESIGDKIEQSMITKIFTSDMDKADKILQKELVVQLGAIADLCENTLDRVMIASVKRHI